MAGTGAVWRPHLSIAFHDRPTTAASLTFSITMRGTKVVQWRNTTLNPFRWFWLGLSVPLVLLAPTAEAAETFDGRRAIVIDGDTIGSERERIRLLNIDAPESFRSRRERELVMGLKAKERLAALARSGRLDVERHGRDRYGRTLARVYADGRDLGQILIQEGLALPWQDGPAARASRLRHWCG
jgi:micrococcal nuclease